MNLLDSPRPAERCFCTMKTRLLLLIIALFPAGAGLGQAYEGRACRLQNGALKTQLRAGRIPELRQDVVGDAERWSSSFLRAEGTPPTVSREELEDPLTGTSSRDTWSCTYSATAAQDGRTETAWSEGVAGPGIGEVLIVPIDPYRGARIWIGFGKSEDLFRKNNRPKKVRLHLLQAARMDVTQSGLIYYNLQKSASLEHNLSDRNGWQDLPVPGAREGGPQDGIPTFALAIEILEVYRGSRYNDTLISEVQNVD